MQRFLFFLSATLLSQTRSLADGAVRYPEAERLARASTSFFAQCIEPRFSFFAEFAWFFLAVLGIFWFTHNKRAQDRRHAAVKRESGSNDPNSNPLHRGE